MEKYPYLIPQASKSKAQWQERVIFFWICWLVGSHRSPDITIIAIAFGYPPEFEGKTTLTRQF